MSILRVTKEMITRYGIKSLYKGFMSHYLPLLLTTTCLIKCHSLFGVTDQVVDKDMQQLSNIVYLGYFLMYPFDTFCRNKMIFTKISKVHIYEAQYGASSYSKQEQGGKQFDPEKFEKSMKRDAKLIAKNAGEYQTSYQMSQSGHSYVPKINHHYLTLSQLRAFFFGDKMKKYI